MFKKKRLALYVLTLLSTGGVLIACNSNPSRGYLFRKSYRDKYGTYYDYSQEKKAERTRYKAKRKALLIPYGTIGIVFLIVGFILAFFRF